MFKTPPVRTPDCQRVRPLYAALALVCTGLAAAGLVLPLLPTTPFLLVAVWAAARGSPRLEQWIYRQRSFAAVLNAWKYERAVPSGAKLLACLLMLASWLALWATGSPAWVLALVGALLLCVASFLLTRPLPARVKEYI